MNALTVSKLARLTGVSADALRYYERIGLLPEPARTPSGYRVYEEDDAERVRFIKRAQRLGLRLDDIRELVDVRERGLCPCGHTRRLLERRMAEIDREMETLAGLRVAIAEMVEELPVRERAGSGCSGELIRVGRAPRTTTRPRKEESR